jgi:hypothetical protein
MFVEEQRLVSLRSVSTTMLRSFLDSSIPADRGSTCSRKPATLRDSPEDMDTKIADLEVK